MANYGRNATNVDRRRGDKECRFLSIASSFDGIVRQFVTIIFSSGSSRDSTRSVRDCDFPSEQTILSSHVAYFISFRKISLPQHLPPRSLNPDRIFDASARVRYACAKVDGSEDEARYTDRYSVRCVYLIAEFHFPVTVLSPFNIPPAAVESIRFLSFL